MKKYLNLPKLFLLILVVLFCVSPCVYSKELSGKFIKLKSEKYECIKADYTELKDGRLLISNGTTMFQIYNPKTNKFEKVTQPKCGSRRLLPITLSDGQVFLPGFPKDYFELANYGADGEEPYEDCEFSYIYNPITDTYKKSAKMLSQKPIITYIKLNDGRIFFIHEKIISIEKDQPEHIYAEIYNPKTDSFELAGESSINIEETIVRVGDKIYSKEEYEYDLYKEAKKKKAEEKKKRIAEMYNYPANDLRNKLNKKLFDDEETPKEEPKPVSVPKIKPVYEKRKVQDYRIRSLSLDNAEILLVWDTYGAAEIYNADTNKFREIPWIKSNGFDPRWYYLGNNEIMVIFCDKKMIKLYNLNTQKFREVKISEDSKLFESYFSNGYELSNGNVLFVIDSYYAILYDVKAEKFQDLGKIILLPNNFSELFIDDDKLLIYGGSFPAYSGAGSYKRKMRVYNVRKRKTQKVGYTPIFHDPIEFIKLNNGNLLLETLVCDTKNGPCYSVFYLYKVKSKKHK